MTTMSKMVDVRQTNRTYKVGPDSRVLAVSRDFSFIDGNHATYRATVVDVRSALCIYDLMEDKELNDEINGPAYEEFYNILLEAERDKIDMIVLVQDKWIVRSEMFWSR